MTFETRPFHLMEFTLFTKHHVTRMKSMKTMKNEISGTSTFISVHNSVFQLVDTHGTILFQIYTLKEKLQLKYLMMMFIVIKCLSLSFGLMFC